MWHLFVILNTIAQQSELASKLIIYFAYIDVSSWLLKLRCLLQSMSLFLKTVPSLVFTYAVLIINLVCLSVH